MTSDEISITPAINSAMLQAIVAALADPNYAGAELRIYAGGVPGAAAQSIGSAVLLCKIRNGDDEGLTLIMDGVVLRKDPTETWIGTNIASGLATFYRLVRADDADGASPDMPRIQGRVGLVGASVNLTDLNLLSGSPQDISQFMITMAEAQ